MKRRTPPTTAPTVARTVRRRRKKPATPPARDGQGDATTPGRARRAAGPESPLPPGVPSRLGPYRLLEVLGEGGMGTVYLAEETENLRRRVAVKWIRTALVGEAARLRFAAERRALARVNHPSIAQIFEAGTDDSGRPYIVMEYVPGGRITEFCARSKPPPDVVLGLLADLARGLLHAHRQGILHRDIKPSNVLVKDDPDEGPTPKVIDFGLAKLLDATVQLTRPGDVLGTPAYMSPEQLRGEAVDRRTDVFAFGVLVRELFTGAPDGEVAADSGPDGVGRFIGTCVAPDPDERYGDFAALLEDLEALKAEQESRDDGAPDGDLAADLRRFFEAGAGRAAERLLEIFEEAAGHSDELLRSTVMEAGRQREANRRRTEARDRLVEAAADCYLGAVLGGFVLGGSDETARGCFLRAIEIYTEVLESTPDVAAADDYVHLGDALLLASDPGEEDLEGAAYAYRQALEMDARCASARYGLAVAGLAGYSAPDEWMGAAWRSLEIAPESAAANNHLGAVLYESRKYPQISLYGHDKAEESLSAYEKALEIDASLAAVHFNLGLVLLASGDGDRASEAFRRAFELGRGVSALQRIEIPVEGDSAADAAASGPLEILPFHDPGRSLDPHDEAAGCYRRGRRLAWDDAEAARECFVRAEQLRRSRP